MSGECGQATVRPGKGRRVKGGGRHSARLLLLWLVLSVGGLWVGMLGAPGRGEAQEQGGPQALEQGGTQALGQESLEGRSLPWLLEEAGSAYQEGDYGRAVKLYEAALAGGAVNGEVFYNLGNAWQRQGKSAEAILAYRKAQLFLPRDGDVEANLSYVRERRADKQTQQGEEVPAWRRVLFWYDVLSLGELLRLAGVMNAVFWGLLALKQVKPELELRWVTGVSGLVMGLLLTSWGVKRWELEKMPDGVVLESSVSARSGTDVKSVVLFTLSAGSEVGTQAQQGEWVQVEVEGKRGWVEKRFLGLVQPP